MSHFETRHGAYLISTDPTSLDLDVIHRWLATKSYWARGRTRETVERSVAGSLNFGAYTSDGSMVGGLRVVGDGVTFGWLCDVFVLDEHRGSGLGKALLAAAMAHPAVRDLKRLMLATADAHGLYARHGFDPLDAPERWMIRRGSID